MKNLNNKDISKSDFVKKNNILKKRILVWLDFGPYPYFYFGIISELSKSDDFEFIGIVTRKQDMSFFQNQQLIQFKELIYYPDCYINNSKYDLKKLEKFEEQYGLNIWQEIFGDRSFYKYWIDFYKFSKDEIFSIVENSISFFIDILKKTEPNLVLLQQPGENISNLLLYKISKKTGIKTLTPNLTYMHDKIIFSDNVDCREISNEFLQLVKNPNSKDEIYNEQFLKNNSLAKSMNVLASFNYNAISFYQKFQYYIKRMWTDSEPIYLNKGKTRLKMLKNRYKSFLKIRERKHFLDLHSVKSIEDKKFLYFPLQSEPESIVQIKSPFYSDVITLVENLAKSIPIDSILYVKEHPIQKEKLWRSIDVYQKIIDIPNVKLIHPDVNSQELISKSQGIICLSGATGFEAIFHKKPVILLSDEYYDVLSMVKKVSKFSELPTIIQDSLQNYKFNNHELSALVQASTNQSLSIPYFSMIKDGVVLSSIQKNENFSLTFTNFQNYYETYKNYFSLIAEGINSKNIALIFDYS